jgi:hypothetical protein
MKKYEILYDWPIAEIARLADSDDADVYASQLAEPEQSNFVALTERMRILGAELATAKAGRQHFPKWTELRSHVDAFGRQFASFPAPCVDRLKLSLLLADKLSQSSPALDTVDIDADAFELRELTQPVPFSWFCRENGHTLTDSVVVLSCVDHSSVESEIAGSNVSPNLLFHFMAALHGAITLPTSQAVVVKRTIPQVDSSAINAFVRLAVLATGRPVHSAHRYANPPSVLEPDEICPGVPYQQWGEVLNVLSEYNSRDEILLKFLTIYHVVENFMFRRPIVELERQRNGAMFSIRDFRRLYELVEMNESDALKRLFTAVLKMPALAGITFEQHIAIQWAALVPSVASQDQMNAALDVLGVKFTFNDFQVPQTASYFSKLVYAFRNAIVHNKETEFHLTYATMDATVCSLIERFLLPSLEEVCFSLICKPNVELWYQNSELQLYK